MQFSCLFISTGVREGKRHPLVQRPRLPHEQVLEAVGSRQDARDRGHGGEFDQQRKVALQHSVLEAIIIKALRVLTVSMSKSPSPRLTKVAEADFRTDR